MPAEEVKYARKPWIGERTVFMDNAISYRNDGTCDLDIHIFDLTRDEAEKLLIELGQKFKKGE